MAPGACSSPTHSCKWSLAFLGQGMPTPKTSADAPGISETLTSCRPARRPALHLPSKPHQETFNKVLIAGGAAPNARDRYGWTPMHPELSTHHTPAAVLQNPIYLRTHEEADHYLQS